MTLLMVGTWYWWPRYIGTFLIYFLCLVNLVYQFFISDVKDSGYAQLCNINMSSAVYKGDYEWDYEGLNYEDEFGLVSIGSFV